MIALVIPSNRPASLERWQREWKAQWEARPDLKLYVIRDEPETWSQIERDLGDNAWIIPRQTDCIRSYGFLQAYRDGAETICTMDDDCYPDTVSTVAWLDAHEAQLQRYPTGDPSWGWVSTIEGVRPRGLPHSATRPTGLSMGCWSGIPDVDAETQLAGWAWHRPIDQYVPRGCFFPMSGMNLAWRRDLTPALYFGLMGAHLTTGESWGMHRYGDIWAGLFAKRIADHLGYAVHTGQPLVHHDRASDPHVNLERERTAKTVNEWLWREVARLALTGKTTIACYHELADALATRLGGVPYFATLARAMHVWATLYEPDSPSAASSPNEH